MALSDEGFSHSTSRVSDLTNPFGIYVHIPFCVHKCSYCDFYSFTQYGQSDFARLVTRVTDELGEAARWLRSATGFRQSTRSVFIGGGTPSLLPLGLLEKLTGSLQENFEISPDAEITIEANPETVTDAFCEGLLARTRINRVSLGAQSFQPANLAKLERLGSRESIVHAVGCLRRAGITNFSLDLIFGIPGQGRDGMLADIDEAIALGPRHLSFYNLTLKPAHVLFRQLPLDDEAADLYEAGSELLRAKGYAQYEISNFAQPGFESRHNLLYWEGGDYLGVGPSAASRFFWNGCFHHRKQVSEFGKYVASAGFPVPPFEPSSAAQTVLEACFLELRKNRGVEVARFRQRYGYTLAAARKYPLFLREGLIEEGEGIVRLTPRGRLLADSVTRDLVD